MRGRARPRAGVRVHGDTPGGPSGVFSEIYELVRQIPPGRVMTYGQIAALLGHRVSPRAVGWAMHGCPADVPWHRVVNARGGCSTDRLTDMPPGLQRALLEREGVRFGSTGRIDLARYRWTPAPPSPHREEPQQEEAPP